MVNHEFCHGLSLQAGVYSIMTQSVACPYWEASVLMSQSRLAFKVVKAWVGAFFFSPLIKKAHIETDIFGYIQSYNFENW